MDTEGLRNGRRSRAGSQAGSIQGGRRRDWRGSSSEDENPRLDQHVFASLLANHQHQYPGDHRTYRSDCDEGGPGGAPGPPRSPRSPQLRQSSPFPVESTNRRLLYGASQDRLRPGNGEIIYASSNPKKLSSSSSLSRSGRNLGRRSRGLTPSSSASSGLEGPAIRGGEPYVLDQDPRLVGLCISHDPGEDSPPEPAPPEVPPRGPSLRRTGQAAPPAALETVPNCNFYNGEYIVAGSPRTESRAARSPVSLSNASSSQHRLTPSQLQGGMGTLGGNGGGGGGGALGVPAFPLRARPSAAHCAPYSPSRFHIDKRCQHRCSWKCFSIIMILVAVVLASMLAYFATLSSIKQNVDSTNCILVQDVKAVTHDQMTQDSLSTQSPTEESAATAAVDRVATTLSVPHLPQQQTQAQHWPPTLELRDFDVHHSATIPPFQFWNSEFRNKQPAYVTLNFTLPWGANFAVYGRRNVAPSVTQYDFVEFVRGGRVGHRIRRSVENNASSETDILNSILKNYDGTDRILSDGERRGPFYVPRADSISYEDNDSNESPILRPRPTIDLQFKMDEHIISKRSALPDSMMVNVSLLQYLDTGRWFLSVYNDELQPHNVELIVSEAEGVSNSCPNDCSGRGSCYLGKCDCIDGFQGIDCSKSVCPVLCSGHGQYGAGVCHCEDGWKGPECDVPKDDCLPADCGGRGRCIDGICRCQRGWKGEGCNEADCPEPGCSGHGACVSGRCYCKVGWKGESCSDVDHQVYKCLPGCSQHGTYDSVSGKCICNDDWTGSDCSQAACGLDCGAHGWCAQGKCQCAQGWTGSRCEQKSCDDRCSAHGQCKNGTCVCSQGWNGKHCTLPGCENGCSRHGQCTLEADEYRCVCIKGWAGSDCSKPLELECTDQKDNDQDGTVDCFDSDCCYTGICKEHIMCLASNEPADVLLRKQPPSVTASFYQRVKFLVEENSVQSYAHTDEYSESRVSVIRGQVLNPEGLGVIGIRVSVNRETRFGFTLTRQGGWFDVLVNGGGAVILQFQRAPFEPITKTVYVPWNQIVVLPSVYMKLVDEGGQRSKPGVTPNRFPHFWNLPGLSSSIYSYEAEPCFAHDHELLSPQITGTWAPHTIGGQPGRSLIFAESQVVQESIPIPGSDLHLMYLSSQTAGYLSTVHMKLTHDTIPPTLTHVHVRVEIEGSLHEKTYESDPNLTHTFAWNKRNVYKQKVYGVVPAKISIGYQHSSCQEPVWETQTVSLQGCDVDISDIGGWGLDIHHHYNFHEGILQKGDGSTLHLKQYPRTVQVVMGTGLQRPLLCSDHCNGKAKDAKLLTPVALASGPDGSLYVGDFNLIRRITPEGTVHTVLQLTATQVAYQYYLCVSPADGHLYISDPEKHQILRILSLDAVQEPTINLEPVVGNGERCIPGDETNCGDDAPAIHARLSHPKGLAIAADKTMYIADGTNIRAVDPKGIIHTIVGHHGHHNHWSPAPCIGAIPAHQAQLQWPTGLSLSPLDGSLHFIDDRLVLKLTPDMKVKLVAGTPLHCRSNAANAIIEPADKSNSTAIYESKIGNVLGTVLSLSFAPTGELYIAEADSRRVNSIKCIDTSGKITIFAGKQNEKIKDMMCECNTSSTTSNPQLHRNADQVPMNCPCINNMFMEETTSNAETLLSSNAKFQAISALSVSPDGVLNVADQGSLHILALKHYLPSHDESGEFHIPYPPTSEIYVFNRYGQHIATKDLASAKTRYSFLYSKNTSLGKLSTVTDASGNKIQFLRDYSNLVSSIENTQDHKSELKMSGVGFLIKLIEKGRSEIELDYDSNTGLLNSKSGGGETFIYEYDDLGRATTLIVPTGEVINIGSSLVDNHGLLIEINNPIKSIIVNDKQHKSELLIEGQNSKVLAVKNDEECVDAIIYSNDTLSVITPWGGKLETTAMAKHPLLEAALPVEAEMLRMWSHQKTTFGDNIVNIMSSVYSLVGDVRNPQQTLNREIWVNGSKVLAIEFDQFTSKETFYDRDHQPLLVITYDPAGLPQTFVPFDGAAPLNISYDRFNRIDGWKWGRSEEKYNYDRHGLLSEITSAQDGTKIISYNDWNLVSKITLASQRRFSLVYDDDGGLRQVILPSGTKHAFSISPSLGFLRVTYTPPGNSRSYLQHYSHSGALLQTVYPGDGARIVYRYHGSGRLAEVVHGDGRTEIKYSKSTGLPSEVLHTEREMDYRWDYQYIGGLLMEERIDFGAKTGLNNAKFTYEYDSNYRLTSVQGRVGGQSLPSHNLAYSSKTGAPEQVNQFKITKQRHNETMVSDGTALFTRNVDEKFLERQITVTIHRVEVFRMEFSHDRNGRISQTRTYTRNVGVNTYTNIKNYTWDADGQLTGVEGQEPWGFKYDNNGNMLSLNYKGNTIPMEYNAMDRILKFGEGQYRYDNRGLVAQNAREEKFQYNTKGLLIRATKKGRFDVRYYYDHLDRLSTRKDNFGNVTQFFYTNPDRPHEVSQIYSPRDGKLMTLVYDDRGHLIFAQVYRHKYYFATDQCGTPIMIFNQYGEGIREMMRSPYGHIVYDSHPYMYLPIDFCGGILDTVTSLVHMPNGKMYDPLLGQWMTPLWENIVERVANPIQMHLYRFNGNDPINLKQMREKPTDHLTWLSRLGYNLKSLAPQLFPNDLPGGSILPPISRQPSIWEGYHKLGTLRLPSLISNLPATDVKSGFLSFLSLRTTSDAKSLSSPPRSALKQNVMDLIPKKIGSASDPPFGKGILVSRTPQGQAIVSSVPSANAIYKDVYTSVFNRSSMLPFTFVVHSAQQDAFYFVKEETWRASEDKQQLKRMQGQVNTTFHEIPRENGSGNNYLDVKIHGLNAVINLRYGTTAEKEKQRLLHHARVTAVRKAWHKEKDIVHNGFSSSMEWSASEIDEIQKQGYVSNYEGEYVHDIQTYPELAEDPYNIRFVKKQTDQSKRKRRKRQSKYREKSKCLDSLNLDSLVNC